MDSELEMTYSKPKHNMAYATANSPLSDPKILDILAHNQDDTVLRRCVAINRSAEERLANIMSRRETDTAASTYTPSIADPASTNNTNVTSLSL